MTLRRLPIQAGILTSFALTPFWLKWPSAPHPFSAEYVLGFVLIAPLIWTLVWWLAMGLPGLRDLLRRRTHQLWLVVLISFATWAALSQTWAFMAEDYPGLAQSRALQLSLTIGFGLVVACVPPPRRLLLAVLVSSLGLHAGVGLAQVANQADIGLHSLGEFRLDPAVSGVSVVQAEGERWLRPYGLISHPNIYAGMLVVMVLAASAAYLWARPRHRWLILLALLPGIWALALTFSRSAWLGLAVGGGVLIALSWAYIRHHWRPVAMLGVTGVLMAGLFMALYAPFVLARAGAGQEETEVYSVGERLLFTHVAAEAIRSAPVTGIGAGNFPWFGSVYLFENSDFEIRGRDVHNIFLTLWAELGAMGLGLFALALLLTYGIALRGPQRKQRAPWLAGLTALMVIGLFDHYPVTLIQGNTLLFGLIGLAITPPTVAAAAPVPPAGPPHNRRR